MNIQSIRVLLGPNLFHHKPVLLLTLDLGTLTHYVSDEHPEFKELLLALLPRLSKHRCSPGYEGGFVERLNSGTYLAHIIEHVALEFSTLTDIEVGYGKTIYGGKEGIYQIAVRYISESGMKYILETAVSLVQALVNDEKFELTPHIIEAKRLIAGEKLGPSTQAVIDAAEKRNIPWRRLNNYNMIQFGYGKNRMLIQATTTSFTSDIAVDIAQNKDLTKTLLAQAFIPVPSGEVVYTEKEAIEAMNNFEGTVVLKPDDGHQGKGVSLGVNTISGAKNAFKIASKYSSGVIVEQQFFGKDYRILVVGDRMIAAAQRIPAHVIGDGFHTISELMEIENQNPERGEGHEKPLTKIRVDGCSELFLKKRGLDLKFVPKAADLLFLRETANLSTGGMSIDVTDQVHPEIKSVCERAARMIGLDICGVDLIADDISKPMNPKSNGIIEVNAGPGIRMHHFPSQGVSRNVGAAIIEHRYPKGKDGRIPIISITGTNGKTTVTRLIAHVLRESGKRIGMTCSDGIYVDQFKIVSGDTTGPQSARAILSDPGVEVAILETARGGIVKRGLGFDWCDTAIMTNIQPDHIGQDGIETVEDIFRIKSLVAERVRDGGTLILNADDEVLAEIREKNPVLLEGKNIVYFSLKSNNKLIATHLLEGRDAYFVRNGFMIEGRGKHETLITHVSRVPMTFGGTAAFQVANALAGIAALRAQGLSAGEILQGLKSFEPHSNSGRVNLYRVKNGYVVLDYGHNPGALTAMSKMVTQWGASRITGVIASPGDRSDGMIQMSGKIAAKAFDRIVIREDEDLRGRAEGETSRLLAEAVKTENPALSCTISLDSKRSLSFAIREMVKDEIIVYFYDKIEESLALLESEGAVKIEFSELRFTEPKRTPDDLPGLKTKSRKSAERKITPPPFRPNHNLNASGQTSPLNL